MAKTDLTNQRQVFVEEYVRSGDHLEAAKKVDRHEIVKEYWFKILSKLCL